MQDDGFGFKELFKNFESYIFDVGVLKFFMLFSSFVSYRSKVRFKFLFWDLWNVFKFLVYLDVLRMMMEMIVYFDDVSDIFCVVLQMWELVCLLFNVIECF